MGYYILSAVYIYLQCCYILLVLIKLSTRAHSVMQQQRQLSGVNEGHFDEDNLVVWRFLQVSAGVDFYR